MGKQFPKNVRQIGNVNDRPKVYVEDYVDSFFRQICEQAKEKPQGAVLVGYNKKQEDKDCLYISGAVQLETVEQDGTRPVIKDEIWKQAEQDVEAYFPGGQIQGWFLALPGQPLRADGTINRIHEKHFTADYTLCILRDLQSGEEIYFAYKFKELSKLDGHYVYYEKNSNMQDYMVDHRKKAGIVPSEQVSDQAAGRFRDLVKERYDAREQKRRTNSTYAMCVCLVLAVLIIGITMQKNTNLFPTSRQEAQQKQRVEEQSQTKETEGNRQDAQETVATSGSVTAAGEIDEAMDAKSETSGSEPQEVQQGDSTMKEMSEDIYIVEKGDTLAQISRKVYGDTGHVDAICRMNGLSDGNLIFIGQKLLLP